MRAFRRAHTQKPPHPYRYGTAPTRVLLFLRNRRHEHFGTGGGRSDDSFFHRRGNHEKGPSLECPLPARHAAIHDRDDREAPGRQFLRPIERQFLDPKKRATRDDTIRRL